MTGTDAALFSSLEGRAQFLTVGHGAVSPTEGY
jgi:DNA replication and repair protein RecF